MISIKQDRIGNFIEVVHIGSGDYYRLHQDDREKLGTESKVAVYEQKPMDYLPPSKEHPKGHYRARVKYFVASYLVLPSEAAQQTK